MVGKIFFTLGSGDSINLEIFFNFLQCLQPADLERIILVSGSEKFHSELAALSTLGHPNAAQYFQHQLPWTYYSGIALAEQRALKLFLIPKEEHGESLNVAGEIEYLLQSGQFSSEHDVLFTLPARKKDFYWKGHQYLGHTEFLRALTKRPLLMGFGTERAQLVLLTDHVALEGVVPIVRSFYLNPSAYSDAFIQVLSAALRKQKRASKLRIVLLGLNPHASEQGLLGEEDLMTFQQPLLDWIKHCAQKAVEQESGLQQQSMPIVELIGPISADSSARYFQDPCLIISPYHDQGLSLLKSIFGHDALHQTYGLKWKGMPLRRYSVDHGTADDIAHQGKAKYHSLLFAWNYLVTNAIIK